MARFSLAVIKIKLKICQKNVYFRLFANLCSLISCLSFAARKFVTDCPRARELRASRDEAAC